MENLNELIKLHHDLDVKMKELELHMKKGEENYSTEDGIRIEKEKEEVKNLLKRVEELTK